MEMSSFMDCKDTIEIVDVDGDTIKVPIELTEDVKNLLTLLSYRGFIYGWDISEE